MFDMQQGANSQLFDVQNDIKRLPVRDSTQDQKRHRSQLLKLQKESSAKVFDL